MATLGVHLLTRPFLSLLYHSLVVTAFFADEYSAEKENCLGHYSQYRDFASKGKYQAENFLFMKNDETFALSSIGTRSPEVSHDISSNN